MRVDRDVEGRLTGAYIPPAKRDDWRTPRSLIGQIESLFRGSIGLDPCASRKPRDWFALKNLCGKGEGQDGLTFPWHELHCPVYVNPPFRQLGQWTRKAWEEHARGCEILLLMPSRTDTKAWHRDVATADAVCLMRGRLRFIGARSSAPFPTALVYWGPRVERFLQIFSPLGMIFSPKESHRAQQRTEPRTTSSLSGKGDRKPATVHRLRRPRLEAGSVQHGAQELLLLQVRDPK